MATPDQPVQQQEQQPQLNIPSLVVILVLSGLIIRYLFFSSSGPGAGAADPRARGSAGRAAATTEAALRAREAAAERITQMFPQVDRRTALWDLQRTGGNVGATAERVLAGRLETPPITFQPPPLPGSNNSNGPKPAVRPVHPDLITRYNLKGKLDSVPASEAESSGTRAATGADGKGARKGWSYDREERQSLLQKRRDQMILEARRKMEAKIAAEKAAKAAGP